MGLGIFGIVLLKWILGGLMGFLLLMDVFMIDRLVRYAMHAWKYIVLVELEFIGLW